jgi:predicted phage terminase large subunit-like protein
MSSIPTAEELQNDLDRVIQMKAEVQRKLVLEDRRLDVLARILGYKVLPFHWILIQAKRRMVGPWRMYLAPRGSGKSTILTVLDSVLMPMVEPNIRMLLASRVKDQSKDILTEVKGCFEIEKFVELFGDLKGEKWGSGEATIKTRTKQPKEPTWLAAGADGPITSKHFDIIKADDLVDEKNARTEGERERIYTFFYKTLVPTLMLVRDDGTRGEIDIIGTRYHPEDVYARLEEDRKVSANICEIPALVDPLTGHRSADGVSIIPEMLPTEDLKDLRISMGTANFDSQYQMSTKRMKGEIFNNDMFRYTEEKPFELIKALELKVWAACDLAVGEGEEKRNDNYSDAVIGVDDRDPSTLEVYVLEMYDAKIPYHVQIARASYIFDKWDPIRFGIEANAFQKSRLYSVYRELGGDIGDRCIPIVTLIDKVTRAWKLSARYEAGRIIHRKNDPMTEKLEYQLIGFPKVKHDDMFDSLDLAVQLGCIVRARKKRKKKLGLFGKKSKTKILRR